MREAPGPSLSLPVIRYGTDAPLPERIGLRAGPLALIFEAGDLREIRLGQEEVLRRIYLAVRDRNWDTIPATLSDVRVERGRDAFAISYRAEHRGGGIDLAWRVEIRGEDSGTVRFQVEGEARSTFLRNRIGLCVHHPIAECAGRPCRVELVDGTTRDGAFPLEIAPHQPFRNLRAIAHEVISGVRAEVRFAGEVFEMEDQRNWTDASFKTYGTPLDLPFPVEVSRGARIVQSVILALSGVPPITAPAVAPSRGAVAALEVGNGPARRLPDLGLGMASHGQPLRPTEVARLRALHLSHLRLDLVLSRPGTAETLRRGSRDAAGVGVPLEIALFLSEDAEAELKTLRRLLDEVRPEVRTWWVFHASEKATTERLARLARESLGSDNPSARFGGGTNAYFAELNRARPPVPTSLLDLLGYSLNPQVHAFDLSSLVENLDAQADTVTGARRLAGGLPVAVGPITLKPRFNPNATVPEPDPGPGELPSQVDPRQLSLFGAGWVVGSLRSLALAGASSLTYFETVGWRGVMEMEGGSPSPGRFCSLPGSVFPLYHVLADVGEFAGGGVRPLSSDEREMAGLDGLALVHGDRLRVLLANHGPSPRPVRVANLRARARIKHLDETNAIEAMRSPDEFRAQLGESRATILGAIELEIPPFGVVRIDNG